ncbi:MAG: HD domain-containing protein [Candidatus Shapirobacteria bacterium]|jgi:putative hydrolase of HD superfamily
MQGEIKKFFEFYKLAEKLKTELRHSWTSNSDRRESVAEHIWMTLLVALTLMDKVKKKVDKLRVLKMLIIHDLGEAIVGDIPSHEISQRQDAKPITESEGIREIVKNLSPETSSEIIALWEEFEAKQTLEAKFAYALDKLECLLQHDIADIKTWDEGDYRYTFVEKQDTPFDYDTFMRALKDTLDDWTFRKAEEAGVSDRIPSENLERYKSRRNLCSRQG